MRHPSHPLSGGHGCGAGTYGVVRILGGERPTLLLYGSGGAGLAIHLLTESPVSTRKG
ncbi:hypothetical protein GCM10009579_60080 [Streptomyces javensis]|uniref:Uncharacterized protein n=1 Tax=Streptomyces javensis TaxID=114698 RepID=A0ABN1X6J7_9ACTN